MNTEHLQTSNLSLMFLTLLLFAAAIIYFEIATSGPVPLSCTATGGAAPIRAGAEAIRRDKENKRHTIKSIFVVIHLHFML